MPNITSEATILNINQSMSPTSDNAIGFCKPMFEDIFVFSSELAASNERPPYYGDEITLGFWGKLNMNFGMTTAGSIFYTLYSDWKYKYYYNQKKFIILDENGNTVLEKNNVVDISQFPIDFSVHKSHQFEIIISDASSTSTFYIPTGLVSKVYGESPSINNGKIIAINNVYLPNYFRPPSPTPTTITTTIPNTVTTTNYRIEQIYDDTYVGCGLDAKWEITKYPSTIGGVRGKIDIDYANHAIPTSQLYSDNFIPFHAIKQPMTFKTQMLQYRWMLAILSVTLFPALCPTLMPGEAQNNRPVYEPWLIWGVMKFLGNKEFGGPYYPWDDEDTPNIDVLDGISPNWAY